MRRVIRVFFAFQYHDTVVPRSVKEDSLVSAVKETNSKISTEFPDYLLQCQECSLKSGRQVGEQVAELIMNSDIFVVDISEYNKNVLFELGIAYSLQRVANKKTIWLAHETVDLSEIPSDLRGLYIYKYNEKSLKTLLSRKIQDLSYEIIQESIKHDRALSVRDFWGFPQRGNIDIVCSEIPEKERHYFADPQDRNYLRYAKFADLDSLIFIKTRIAQLYPRTTIRDFSSSEYFDTSPRALIIIGGPPWNRKFREFQAQLPFHFVPRPLGEDDPLLIDENLMKNYVFLPTWKRPKELIKDISLFVRIRVDKIPVFLIGGCLTFGVLGAAKCFLEARVAPSNVEYAERLAEDNDFVLVCESYRAGVFVKTPNFNAREPLVVLVRKPNGQFRVSVNNAREYERPDIAKQLHSEPIELKEEKKDVGIKTWIKGKK